MGFRSKIINLLGGEEKTTNNYSRGNDFLRYGNRGKDILMPDWADIKMSDKDLYKGYSYAAIQKRANKVATLARTNLFTFCNDELGEALRERNEDAFHPYLKLIEDSTDFSQKQFWKNISIYLDLAGVYYLGVVRGKIPSNNPNAKDLYTPAKSFVMLNPYEVRRVLDKDKNVVGYIEKKPDGRQREWPAYMIIEMRELNPFDNERIWSLTDASREAAFTINQSNDYTRKTLAGNINAPGIVTTDVILDDEQFRNFRERIVHHTSGEPLFGNGTGAINWTSMTNDLDKSALGEINEMNRTALFAVSGVSKTILGIEQSGTTRETSRVQSEQFLSDTIQPRIEDIIDFLNLDYRRHYPEEYKQTGYYIEVQGFGSKDYDTSIKATEAHAGEINLALDLIDMGYTVETAYQYASGEIEIEDLVLEDGKEKPERPKQDGNDLFGGLEPQDGGSDGGDGGNGGNEPEAPSEPSGEVVEPIEETEETTNDLEDGMAKRIETVDELFHFMENHEEGCTCEDCKNPTKIEVYENELGSDDAEELRGGYQNFLAKVKEVEAEIFEEASSKISRNSFEEIDIITKEFKKKVTNKLQGYIDKYWGGLVRLFGNSTVSKRNKEFDSSEKFTITNDIQGAIVFKATETAENHVQTIIQDILKISNKVYTDILEETAAELLVDRYKQNPDKYVDYFKSAPSKVDALKAVRKTDILEFDKKLYQKAYETALKGQSREKISKTIRDSYDGVSKKRADLIARNETSRAFNYTQYEADLQFLTNTGKLNNAYKELYSRSGNPCPICKAVIDMGPIPFTKNFVDFGGTVDYVDDKGQVKQFVANYEPISAGILHPNCMCSYRLVIRNDKVENKYHGLFDPNDSSVSNTVQLLSNYLNEGEVRNGGQGSGNFGHLGRPGLVGGSGKSGVIAESEQTVSAKWLESNRESLKAKGYTDEWVDEQIGYAKSRDLKGKAEKAKTVEKFDKAVEEMKKEGVFSEIWWSNVGERTRVKIEADTKRREEAVNPDQQEAIDNLMADTGIYMKPADEKWLRGNVPKVMVEALHNELNQAFNEGLGRNVRIQFTDAEQKQGSCTVEGKNYDTVLVRLTKNMMSNSESTLKTAAKLGKDGDRWWTCESDQIGHTIRHELGHALAWQATRVQGLTPYEFNYLNGKIVYNAKKAYVGADSYNSANPAQKAKIDGLRINKDHQFMSKYGGTNAAEAVAESYANENYSPFTKEITKQLREALKSPVIKG